MGTRNGAQAVLEAVWGETWRPAQSLFRRHYSGAGLREARPWPVSYYRERSPGAFRERRPLCTGVGVAHEGGAPAPTGL
ncbi:hypothetical protein NDU88_005056 [Pleurodeles waltl]|uniref:Uncharacterized protein n=1 Tax=Pleurodeles waltl TaxID=8319 RepID=A0AAV7MIB0_PLEWA|nr:hypothetical protein NDU88_005056 [Pleurodeles waltl]